jgi:uncharacterized protein
LFDVTQSRQGTKPVASRKTDANVVLSTKMDLLKKLLEPLKNALVAFSGGVDSGFLLAVAHGILGERVLAVTAVSSIHPLEEGESAGTWASRIGVEHMFLSSDEMEDELFLENTPERCYICKKRMFLKLKTVAEKRGLTAILDGSNSDDLADFRPGTKALREIGVRSPLQEAGLTKSEIRALARQLDFPLWDKPALACLATRIPYGTRIVPDALKRVDKAERFLRNSGFHDVRVRDHDGLARIELGRKEMPGFLHPKTIRMTVEHLKSLGYSMVTLDLEGYRTGSLNEMLKRHESGRRRKTS